MRQIFSLILTLVGVCVSAQTVKVTSDVTLTDSAAYFPQLSLDGKYLVYAPTDAHPLLLQEVATCLTARAACAS